MPSASRNEPVALRATRPSAAGSMSIDSCSATRSEDLGDLLDRRTAEIEPVAAIDDGREHLLGLGRREHEDRPRRGLLQGLQESVPRLLGEHVSLVKDVHLVAPGHRCVGDLLPEIADVVDRVVGGGVHLDHVKRRSVGDRDARVAVAARRDGRPVDAVQTRGEDLRHARLARPPRADEQVRVVDLLLRDGVRQRADNVLLPDDVSERPGTVAAVERRAGRHGLPSLVVGSAGHDAIARRTQPGRRIGLGVDPNQIGVNSQRQRGGAARRGAGGRWTPGARKSGSCTLLRSQAPRRGHRFMTPARRSRCA